MTHQRPPFPIRDAICPDCTATIAAGIHEPTCPLVAKRRRDQEHADRMLRLERARLAEWGGGGE